MRANLGGMLLLCSSWGYAADTLTLYVDSSSPQFVVTLPANPTTGYQWTVSTYDKTMLRLTSSHYIVPKTKLIGAGGEMTFTFALNKGKAYPKATTMSFTYARSWEPKSGTLKQVTVQFTKNNKTQ